MAEALLWRQCPLAAVPLATSSVISRTAYCAPPADSTSSRRTVAHSAARYTLAPQNGRSRSASAVEPSVDCCDWDGRSTCSAAEVTDHWQGRAHKWERSTAAQLNGVLRGGTPCGIA